MALPEWVERLRPASYTSPNGVESSFKLDLLTRVGGKKATMHEILNSDEGIPQDQGNRALEYPCECYFTDGNGDQESDTFFDSLGEKYTPDNPGILHHPRWGDIPVMPFEFQQSENIVAEGGIFRVPVTFRRVPESRFPTADGLDQSEIVSGIDDLEDTVNVANEAIDVSTTGRFARFSAQIRSTVSVVKEALSPIAETVDDINDRYNQIQADIDYVLSIGGDAVEILSQVNRLIRLPGEIIDSTGDKLRAYATMAEGIFNSFVGFFQTEQDAQVFQSIFSMTTGAVSEAALFTDYSTRDEASSALDFVNNTEQQYLTGIADADGLMAPDHNTGLSLSLVIGQVNSYLINRSFDLKARQTFILFGDSDPITLTWKHYQSVDLEDIEFFIRTNNLQDTQILELPAGTEYVIYE